MTNTTTADQTVTTNDDSLADFDLYADQGDEIRAQGHTQAEIARRRLITAGRFHPLV